MLKKRFYQITQIRKTIFLSGLDAILTGFMQFLMWMYAVYIVFSNFDILTKSICIKKSDLPNYTLMFHIQLLNEEKIINS